MTGRHEFVPILPSSQTDGEEISPYDYADQLQRHHDASLAGWDKQPGIHKLEKKPLPKPNRLRRVAATTLTSFSHPRLGH